MKTNRILKYFISLFNNISIRSKIFIFYIGILLVSLSFFAFLTIRISNQAIVDKATKNAGRELALIDKSLLNLATNSEDYVRILSMDNRLQNELTRIEKSQLDSIGKLEAVKTLSTAISNVVQPNTHIAAASILSYGNDFFDIGFVNNSSVTSVFNKDLINLIRENKTPTWTGLIKIKYKFGGDEDVFAIAKPIIGFDTGSILGTVVLYLKEKDIASIYLDNVANKNDKFYIVDGQKNIISAQDKNELYKKFEEEKYLGSYKLEEVSDVKSLIRNIGDKQTLVTVTDFEKLNWKIISVIPLDEITNENAGITKLIVIFGVTCMIFAFAASYLLSYTISKPILKLVYIMKEIKSGNMKLRASFTAKDEIGMLGDGFNSLMDKINSLLDQIYFEQKLKRENEFKLLQSQIKPHFLYNTIETIISFIKLGLKDNAMMTAKYLAGFYRVSLSKGNDIITIKDEMQLIDSYLSIQKLRYVEYLDFRIDIDEEILKYQVPKLTLQPLVENSIYHGLKQKEDKGMLIIRGFYENDVIKIEVFDDGVGMSEEQIARVLRRGDASQQEVGLRGFEKRPLLNERGDTSQQEMGLRGFEKRPLLNGRGDASQQEVGLRGFEKRSFENETSQGQKKSDFGVHSVDSRLKLLYGEQYGLKIESRVSEFTKVTVTLPAIVT